MTKKGHNALFDLLDVIGRASRDSLMLLAFFQDLLTPAELDDIVKRWQIVQALARGKTHREVAHTLKVSIAKVSRGARVLQNTKGGFHKILRTSGSSTK